MSSWTDRITEHPVWQHMQSLGPALNDAIAREGVDAETVDGIERIRAVLTVVGKKLAGADTQLLQPGPLDSIAAELQQATSSLQAFAQDGSVAHIANANSNADRVLTSAATLYYPQVSDDWNALRDAGTAYRLTLEQNLQSIQATLRDLNSNVVGAKERVAELESDSAAERAQVTSLTSDFQAQFSAAQESRIREFSEGQGARQDKFNSVITEYSNELTEQASEFSRQREEVFRANEEGIKALQESYAASARQVLSEIEAHKTAVEKLVGVIGNLGVTSGYLRVANQARTMTWIWQAITVAAMGGLIIVAYIAFLPAVQGTFSWESFAGRVFVSLTVGVLAAYSAAQADKYVEVERRNRKLALELEALGPYLAPLPIEKQQEFRLQIGDRSFGRDEVAVSRREARSPASVVDVLIKSKELREFIASIVKAARG